MAYQVIVSGQADEEFFAVVNYLLEAWSEKEAIAFVKAFEETIALLELNPFVGRKAFKNEHIRRVLVTPHNSVYYEISGPNVSLLKLIDTRSNPLMNTFD